MKRVRDSLLLFFIMSLMAVDVPAQVPMANFQARTCVDLNGPWQVVVDPIATGEQKQIWEEKKPGKKTEFVEYSFEGGPVLNVPGDFNTQKPELAFYEGVVWYRKLFHFNCQKGKRYFVYFSAVNYKADVYLNGEKLGSHEGGFTPFQFEVTDKIKQEGNSLIVKVDNRRAKDGLPGMGFDWLNFGGITRDVAITATAETYIKDYFIQLQPGSTDHIAGWLRLDGSHKKQTIKLLIPELKKEYHFQTDSTGWAKIDFMAAVKLWSPKQPKLYRLTFESEGDSISDEIGFRSIETKNGKVLLNGGSIFLKCVNIHEENPFSGARACTAKDARILLDAAKELGCNLVRLAHYPHSEAMVREAEKMGMMVWSELPIYQHILFSDSLVGLKMENMLNEMVGRDRNRCAVINWSLSNETYPGTPNRTKALIELTKKCRQIDPTRLIVHVANSQSYSEDGFNVSDSLYEYSDLVAINEYIGWYLPWQVKPKETKWKIGCADKPVFISEFGGEAVFGNTSKKSDEASNWTEGYQEKIYQDQIRLFETVPNLCGVSPWILFDYKSPGRMNQIYQKGYNRKGLLSEKGEKKKAWYIMNEYYKTK